MDILRKIGIGALAVVAAGTFGLASAPVTGTSGLVSAAQADEDDDDDDRGVRRSWRHRDWRPPSAMARRLS
jgi:hypothetical protein